MGEGTVVTSYFFFHLCSVLLDRLFLFLSGFLFLLLGILVRIRVQDQGSSAMGNGSGVRSLYSSQDTSNFVRIVVIGGASGEGYMVSEEWDSDMGDDGDDILQTDSCLSASR